MELLHLLLGQLIFDRASAFLLVFLHCQLLLQLFQLVIYVFSFFVSSAESYVLPVHLLLPFLLPRNLLLDVIVQVLFEAVGVAFLDVIHRQVQERLALSFEPFADDLLPSYELTQMRELFHLNVSHRKGELLPLTVLIGRDPSLTVVYLVQVLLHVHLHLLDRSSWHSRHRFLNVARLLKPAS